MPETQKRIRSREGYVMIELTPEERAKLERIRDRRSAQTGERASLAGVFRWLLRKEKIGNDS